MTSPYSLPLPFWVDEITTIVFLLIFGKFVINKLLNVLREFLISLEIEEKVANSLFNFVTSMFWLYILGLALQNVPNIFSPNIFPIQIVGDLIMRFVSFSFSLILPVFVFYLVLKLKKI